MYYNLCMNKNQRIGQTRRETKRRHSNMTCRTFEIKAVSNKMNKEQKESVNGIFREAKWIRNALIRDIHCLEDNFKKVPVKVGKEIEMRELKYIGSQMKQSMVKSVHSELKALHTKKEKGEKVGALKYRSYCNSVNLKQYGITYSIDFVHNRVKIQGIKKPLYVRGLKQIPSEAEYANAKLVRKADGIYIYVTCYTKREIPVYTGHVEGVDFGIGHNLTMTDGSTIDISIPESKGTKLAAKRVNKGYKHNGGNKTGNHWRRSDKLRVAYKKDKQRRYDAANKAYHQLVYNNDLIAIQDEMIHNWHKGLFGRKIQYSAMGSVKAKLKHNSKVRVVDRSYPSTQICPRCGMLTKHPLIKRDYDCKYCGYHHDSRDQKAANSILEAVLFDHEVSLERRAQSPVEADSSAFMLKGMDCKNSSVKQEASDFSRL